MSAAEPTPGELFDQLARRLEREPQRTAGVTATYQFDISGEQGGQWHVEIVEGETEVREGIAADPDVTFVMRDTDYVAMSSGKLSGMTAFMTGRIKVEGDMSKAMRAAQIFG